MKPNIWIVPISFTKSPEKISDQMYEANEFQVFKELSLFSYITLWMEIIPT